jgi:hypothetical protein
MRKIVPTLALVVIFTILLQPSAQAQFQYLLATSETTKLRSEMNKKFEALEKRVLELEKKVSELEKKK